MRDGQYDIIVSDSIGDLIERVNEARSKGYSPQAQPFEYKGNINQVMTKVLRKPDLKDHPKPPKPPSKKEVREYIKPKNLFN